MATDNPGVKDVDNEFLQYSYKVPVTKDKHVAINHLDVLKKKEQEATKKANDAAGIATPGTIEATPKNRLSPVQSKIVAARERAAAIRESTKDIHTSDLDLDVSEKDYTDVARTHPIADDLDKDVNHMQLVAQHQERKENSGLIAGPGENLKLNRIAEQALKMLGSGLKPSIVASALGVTPGYISQLQENPDFAKAVVERKIITLTRNSEHDDRIHAVEAKALEKLETALPFMNNAKDIARVFTALNNAKRRGAGAMEEEHVADASTVVQLTLPAGIRARVGLQVEVNDKNQVTTAGAQSLGAINPKHLMEHYRDVQKGERDITDLAPQRATQQAVIDAAAEATVIKQVSSAKDSYKSLDVQEDISQIDIDDL